jgi:hypothetical protein
MPAPEAVAELASIVAAGRQVLADALTRAV